MGRIRGYINQKFIESNPSLIEAMANINKIQGRRRTVFGRACLVLQLYVKYSILRYDKFDEKQKKISRVSYPESFVNQKTEIQKIRSKLKENSDVTFDMLGVVFYEALDLNQLLALAESKEHYIGLSEVQNIRYTLSPEQLLQLEGIVADFMLENPIMHSLIEETCRQGKNVYIYNNSDYADGLVQKILDGHQYNIKIVKNIKGLHITNRKMEQSDIEYKNVNTLGEAYRPFCYLNAVTALYNQVVNMQFHSRDEMYPLFYEYGFSYGGILTCGFCQFLNQLAQREGIDKFLFVARDGDIMQKVYKKYFNEIENEYLIFSRFASYELIFEDFPEEYIDKNIKPRMARSGADNSINKILQECGLEILEKYLYEENLTTNEILRKENFEKLRAIVLRHKSEIQEGFAETCMAAKEYIMGTIRASRKVCIVDLGWHGKSIVYLKHLCEKKYKWHGSVTGAMIGASENDVAQDHIRTGLMYIYAFENEYWRSMGTKVGSHMGYEECICLEALFSSVSDTLIRYTYDEKGYVSFIYGKKNKNKDMVAQIHTGILDFAEQFMPLIQKYRLRITERDAYTPIDSAMRNHKYKNMIYQKYYEEPNAINGF